MVRDSSLHRADSAREVGLESPAWDLVVGTDTLPIWLGQLSKNLARAQGTLRGSMGGSSSGP
jgi:hypothetical protein